MNSQTFVKQCHEDGSITISSGGRLSIENAVDFAMCLRDSLAASERVVIVFDANVEVDITTVQILCSACKSAAAGGKSLTGQGTEVGSLQQLLIKVGAIHSDTCKHNNSKLCLWFGGNEFC